MIGRTVVYTDGRHEWPALVTRDRGNGNLDLAVCVVTGDRVQNVTWRFREGVPQTPTPILPGIEPGYLAPDTWRPVQ